MVHDDAAVGLDGVEVVFDDERVVSDAGIALVATLVGRLGVLEREADRTARERWVVLFDQCAPAVLGSRGSVRRRSGGALSPAGACRRARDRSFRPPFCPHVRAVNDRAGPVELAGVLKLIQQRLVQSFPDPSVVPVAKAPPARHSRPASHLLRQILPRDPRFQHEQDARQNVPIAHTLATRVSEPSLDHRQQRLDPRCVSDIWWRP